MSEEAQERVEPSPETADTVLAELVSLDGAKALMITLNRPESLNPVDKVTVARLRRVLEDTVARGDVRVVILTGAGSAFSAGGDLRGYQDLYRDHGRFRQFMTDFDEVCRILEREAPVTIAMVNGTCVAGGLELALACDFVTIAAEARIGDGHLRFAQLPGAGGSQRLVRAIGVQRARQWLLSADLFAASVAVDAGLAVAAVPGAELRQYTLDLAARLCRHSPLALANMKKLIALALTTQLDDGLDQERDVVFDYATGSHDASEGLHAFAERRPPRYLGR